MFGVLCVLATAVLTAIGGAFILLAKVALALLAGLGPLFILALLFKSTTRFFEAWCAQVVTYGLLIVLVSSVFGLMMNIFTGYMTNLQFDGALNFAGSLGGCIILSIACVLIVIQLPTIAAALANGIGVGLWAELSIAARGAQGAAGMAGRMIGSNSGKDGGISSDGGKSSGGKSSGGGSPSGLSGTGNAVGKMRGTARPA